VMKSRNFSGVNLAMIGKVNNKLISIRIQSRNQADDQPLSRILNANG